VLQEEKKEVIPETDNLQNMISDMKKQSEKKTLREIMLEKNISDPTKMTLDQFKEN
jgi:hypothetical protein